jgi:hypothetical protein
LQVVHPAPVPPQFLPPVPGAVAAPASTTTANPLKRPLDKAEVEERSAHQYPKRRNPYGEWSTVSVREEEIEVPQEKEDKEEKEGEGDQGAGDHETDGDIQFEEKKLSEGLSVESNDRQLKGDFKGFVFKKRTSKGRPQTRQRTSDF